MKELIMNTHEGDTTSHEGTHKKKPRPRVIFKGNETWPTNSGASHRHWTLEFGKFEARGAIVFRVHENVGGRTSLEEVVTAWTPGVTLSPPEGIYRAFYLGTDVKPTAEDIKTYIENLFEGEGAPAPSNLRP